MIMTKEGINITKSIPSFKAMNQKEIDAKRIELNKSFRSNHKGISSLMIDLEERIWEFQLESDNEKALVILGLNELVLKVTEDRI